MLEPLRGGEAGRLGGWECSGGRVELEKTWFTSQRNNGEAAGNLARGQDRAPGWRITWESWHLDGAGSLRAPVSNEGRHSRGLSPGTQRSARGQAPGSNGKGQ